LKYLKTLIFLVLLLLQIPDSFAQSSGRKNLAVFTFAARGMTDIEASAISDRIRNEFAQSDQYTILERGMMEEILKEQAFQLSGACSESSCLVEAGQLLAVHYIVGGSVTHVGNLFTLEARIVDVESGKIVKNVIEDYMGPIENLLVYTTKTVVQKLLGVESSSGSITLIGTSDLLVKSNPPGGTIYINDKPIGDITPYTIQGLPEGEIRVKVKKGNLVGEKLVSIGVNEIKEIEMNLAREKFTLRIYSEPSGANILINNTQVGQTPLDYQVIDTSKVYVLKLSQAGFLTKTDTIHFSENNLKRLNYILKPCGQIFINDNLDTDIFLNDAQIWSKKNQVTESRYQVTSSFESEGISIGQLDFTEYEIQMIKKNHEPYITTVLLDQNDRLKIITPGFQMENGQIIIQNSNVRSIIRLTSNYTNDMFSLEPNQIDTVRTFYGTYSISASASKHYNYYQNVDLYSDIPCKITLELGIPSRKSAELRSIFIPGWGQYFSFQPIKGAVFFMSSALSIGWQCSSYNKYNKELDRYDEYVSLYNSAMTINDLDKYRNLCNESKNLLDDFRTQFFVATSITIATYVYNLIDIYFFFPSHRYQQNIGLDYNPRGNSYEISYHF